MTDGLLLTIGLWVGGGLLALGAALAVVRIVVGPSILDRMIASDVLITCLMLAIGFEMVANGHTRTVPLLVALASTALFGTIAVARYVSKHDAGGSGSGSGSGDAGGGAR